jgi:hypothetical protein
LDKYNQLDKDQATIYRTIVGHAIYLSNITRLDIAYATGQLARMIAKPNTNHLSIAKGLLRYLKGIEKTGGLWSCEDMTIVLLHAKVSRF